MKPINAVRRNGHRLRSNSASPVATAVAERALSAWLRFMCSTPNPQAGVPVFLTDPSFLLAICTRMALHGLLDPYVEVIELSNYYK